MFLQTKDDGILVKVMDLEALFDPFKTEIIVQGQEGQEEQEPEAHSKATLVFPSGETLPRCWLDSNYRASL